jgi:hypothetical protein
VGFDPQVSDHPRVIHQNFPILLDKLLQLYLVLFNSINKIIPAFPEGAMNRQLSGRGREGAPHAKPSCRGSVCSWGRLEAVGGTCEGLMGVGGSRVEAVGGRCRTNEREGEERGPS